MVTAEAVREIVAFHLCLGPGEAGDYDSLSEKHGMDSLDRIDIVLSCEDAFGIEVADEVMYGFDTIRQLLEAVL